MVLSKILEQIIDLNKELVIILISKNYITFYDETIERNIITLFNFDGIFINKYNYPRLFGTEHPLFYNKITKCIVPGKFRECVYQRIYYLEKNPTC